MPTFPRPATRAGLSTIDFVYQLISGPNTYPASDTIVSNVIDVRDLAHVHILALSAPPHPKGTQKRLLVQSEQFTWPEAADLLRKERPELASRLPPKEKDSEAPAMTKAPMDTRLSKEVLGDLKFITWQESILASIDAAVAWEKGGVKA